MTTAPFPDDLFKKLLVEGYRWQLKVAQELVSHSLKVYVPPLRWRNSYKDAGAFADDQDIVVGETKKLWLEVKSSYLNFTGPEDVPDPLKLVTVSSWKKLTDKPFGVAVISKKTEAVVFAPTKFEESWEVQNIHDHKRGFEEPWLVCPRPYLYDFRTLIKVLRVRTG